MNGRIDDSYKTISEMNLQKVYKNAEEIVRNVEKLENYKEYIYKDGEKTSAWRCMPSKFAKLGVYDFETNSSVEFGVKVPVDAFVAGREQVAVNRIVNEFLDKYIAEYGYSENVNEVDALLPEVKEHEYFSKGWLNEQAAKADYLYDTIDGQRVLKAVRFPGGGVLERDLQAFPDNAGFNPKFVEMVADGNSYTVRAKALRENQAYNTVSNVLKDNPGMTYADAVGYIGLVYDEETRNDLRRGLVRDTRGAVDVKASEAYRAEFKGDRSGFVRLDEYDTEKRAARMGLEKRLDAKAALEYEQGMSEIMEEVVAREREENSFNVETDFRDRNADKEYSGGTGYDIDWRFYVPKETPQTSVYQYLGGSLQDVTLANVPLAERIGDRIDISSQLTKNTPKGVVPDGADLSLILMEVLNKREGFTGDSLSTAETMKYINDNYNALGNYYKDVAAGFKRSESVISKKAVVDAVLGQQLRYMAVRFNMLEHGSAPERVAKLSDRQLAERPELKYFAELSTYEMQEVVSVMNTRYSGFVKGADISVPMAQQPRLASREQLDRIISLMEKKEVLPVHTQRYNLDDLKRQRDTGKITLTLAEAGKINNGRKAKILEQFLLPEQYKRLGGLADACKVARELRLFKEVKTERMGNGMVNVSFSGPQAMTNQQKEYFDKNKLSAKDFPVNANAYQYAAKVIDNVAKGRPAIVHALRHAKLSVISDTFVTLTASAMFEKYHTIMKNMRDELKKPVSEELRNHALQNGVKVPDRYTYADYNKDCEFLPVRKETLDVIRMKCLEGELKPNDKGIVTEGMAQHVIKGYEDRVFARNNGPATAEQKQFFERFDMEMKGFNELTYVAARNMITNRLEREGAVRPENAGWFKRVADLPGMDYNKIYLADKGFDFDKCITDSYKRVQTLERQYIIDSPALSPTRGLKKFVLDSCRELQTKIGNKCSLMEPEKLVGYIAIKAFNSKYTIMDTSGNRIAPERADVLMGAAIDQIMPKPFGNDIRSDAKSCMNIVSEVRKNLEVKNLAKAAVKAVEKARPSSREVAMSM